MAQLNVTKSKVFIDYLHLSIRFTPQTISTLLKKEKELLYQLLCDFTFTPSEEHYNDIKHKNVKKEYYLPDIHNINCPSCYRSLATPLEINKHVKNSIYLGMSKNWTMSIHFKGSFFQSTKNWKEDSLILIDKMDKVKKSLNQHLRSFGMPTQFDIKVSRIDFAINFYNASFWDAEKQTFKNGQIKHQNYFKYGNHVTSVNLSRKDTDKVYFRSYDKRFETASSRAKAVSRFGTDQFCRNEWKIGSNKLRKLKLKNWIEWVEMFKTPSKINQLILHLRKSRDVTFYKNPKHEYNLIHLEKGWGGFKHTKVFETNQGLDWTPTPSVLGLLKNHDEKITVEDWHQVLKVIFDSTELVPFDIQRDLYKHWYKKGTFGKSINYSMNSKIKELQILLRKKKDARDISEINSGCLQ